MKLKIVWNVELGQGMCIIGATMISLHFITNKKSLKRLGCLVQQSSAHMLWSIYSHSDTVLRIWNPGKSSSDGSMRAPINDSSWVWAAVTGVTGVRQTSGTSHSYDVTTCKYLGSLVIILTGQHTLGLIGLHKHSPFHNTVTVKQNNY